MYNRGYILYMLSFLMSIKGITKEFKGLDRRDQHKLLADLHKILDATHDQSKTPTETICGIAIDKLTDTQKTLFYDKLTPTQKEALAQNIVIKDDQIDFLQLKKAIQTKDTTQPIRAWSVEDTIDAIGDGWILPENYKAMIQEMPGENDAEKIENFKLLTGMTTRYWIQWPSWLAIKSFNQHKPTPPSHTKAHLRLVRDV